MFHLSAPARRVSDRVLAHHNTLSFEYSDNYGEPEYWYATGFYRRKLESYDSETLDGVHDKLWDEIVQECGFPHSCETSLYDMLRVEIATDPDGTEWLEVDPLQ